MNRTRPLAIFASFALLSLGPVPVFAEPTVNFGLPAYAELGLVRQEVRAGYEELDRAQLNLETTLNYAGLALSSVSQAGDLLFVQSATANLVAQGTVLANGVATVNSAASETTVRGIRDSLSPLDLTPVTSSLASISSSLRALSAQTKEPIELPTLYTYYAVAVSGRARQIAEQMLAEAVAGKASLLSALSKSATLDGWLDALGARCRANAQLARSLQAAANDLLGVPLIGIVAYGLLSNLILIESQYDDLLNDVARTQGEIRNTQIEASQRIGEVEELIAALNFALGSTPLGSTWVTSADTGPANAFFNLQFTGRTFGYPYTEIDGAFFLGTLRITNYITLLQGDQTFSATVRFGVTRTVVDPILGAVQTSGSVPLALFYNATPNNGETCGQARDYFSIGSLGINAYVCETDTAAFEVFARYDSPLRIVSLVPVPSTVDPDPAVEHVQIALDVVHGEGSGVFAPGTIVAVVADPPPPGRRFLRWDGDADGLADRFQAATTFAVGSEGAVVEAVFEPIPIEHSLLVVGGDGTGRYRGGSRVEVSAAVPDGFRFIEWTGDVAAVRDYRSARTIAFLDRDVRVAATIAPRDDCPCDRAKTRPGVCGCGRPDVDTDGDDVLDCFDAAPCSDRRNTVILGKIDSGVVNAYLGAGRTMTDELLLAAQRRKNHGQFVVYADSIVDRWKADRLITDEQAKRLHRAVAQSKLK